MLRRSRRIHTFAQQTKVVRSQIQKSHFTTAKSSANLAIAMGMVLDIIVEYLVRVAMRMVSLLRTRSWPKVAGKVTSSFYVDASFGCDLAEICYNYRVQDQLHSGTFKKPFLIDIRGQAYVANLQGADLIVRVKPGVPSVSVMYMPGSVADVTEVNAHSNALN